MMILTGRADRARLFHHPCYTLREACEVILYRVIDLPDRGSPSSIRHIFRQELYILCFSCSSGSTCKAGPPRNSGDNTLVLITRLINTFEEWRPSSSLVYVLNVASTLTKAPSGHRGNSALETAIRRHGRAGNSTSRSPLK